MTLDIVFTSKFRAFSYILLFTFGIMAFENGIASLLLNFVISDPVIIISLYFFNVLMVLVIVIGCYSVLQYRELSKKLDEMSPNFTDELRNDWTEGKKRPVNYSPLSPEAILDLLNEKNIPPAIKQDLLLRVDYYMWCSISFIPIFFATTVLLITTSELLIAIYSAFPFMFTFIALYYVYKDYKLYQKWYDIYELELLRDYSAHAKEDKKIDLLKLDLLKLLELTHISRFPMPRSIQFLISISFVFGIISFTLGFLPNI